jgi:serine/threonine kinase PknH
MSIEPLTGDDPAEVAGYRLRARLGAGGMGRVYLASAPGGRPVALKIVRPEFGDDPEFRGRFQHEVEAARRVHGRYTAQVLDADPDATPPWLATAYVPGPSLREAVTGQGPMPAQAVLALMAGVAEALHAIHAAGVVHRDLKPSNVLLAPDRPRVIDFGVSRAAEATALTRSGIRVGSPNYMAPEQVADLPVSGAADVFALGSLAAYAMLGRHVFGEGSEVAVMYRVLHGAADLSGCPQPLRGIIEQCLAKDAAGRPTPAQIIRLCRARAAPAVPARSPPPSRRRLPARVSVLRVCAAILLAAVAGAGLLVLKAGFRPTAPPPRSWLTGTWIGPADQPRGVVTHWTAELTFPAAGTVGTFRFPSLGCSGTLVVTSATRATASAQEDLTRNPRKLCAPGGLMKLTRSRAHGMDMTWRDSADHGNVATAHLLRQFKFR